MKYSKLVWCDYLVASSIGLAMLLAGAAPAFAVPAQRTFVASYGNDANPDCNLALPCRSFNAAIAQTKPGGEVVILDTAGYGPMVITKSIKVIGPTGVYGGISVQGNLGPTTGILINAGDTDVVTLRGLDVSGVPGLAPLPQLGIDIQNAGAVHIEKSSIGNFTQDQSACIQLDTARAVQLYIVDSFLRECTVGVFVSGTGPTNAERPSAEIDNTRIENARNTTVGGGTAGLGFIGNFAIALRNSIIAGAGDGIYVENTIATATSRAYVIHSHITRTNNAAIEMAGGNNASLHMNVSNSVLNSNPNAILFGHGLLRLTTNVISNNTNAIVNCGGNPASVGSLSYGGSIGSNLISEFSNITPPGGCSGFITPTTITGQ